MQHESLLVLRNPQFWYLAISNNCMDKNSVVEHEEAGNEGGCDVITVDICPDWHHR